MTGAVGLNEQDPGGLLRNGSERRAWRRAMNTELTTQVIGEEETLSAPAPGTGVLLAIVIQAGSELDPRCIFDLVNCYPLTDLLEHHT